MKKAKILIIEDEFIIASNLKLVLSNKGYDVCGLAKTYDEAIVLYNEYLPDIILSDIFLRDSKSAIDAILTLNILKKRQIPVIVISAYSQEKVLNDVLKINPIYFITKPFTENQIIAALKLATKSLEINEHNMPSCRELEVLNLLAKGFSSKLISDELSISINTVESHRKNMMKRYVVSSSAELIYLATKNKWVT